MNKIFRQPVKKRIQDISAFGVVLLVMSVLSGTFKILMLTVPVFLILASVLATGRYKQGRLRVKTHSELYNESQKRIFSGCKNLSTREHTLGY